MKNILAGIAAAALCTPTLAQKQQTIEGNGNVTTREVAVSSFSTLEARGVYELRLSQDTKESVKIEADENLQDYFTVRTEGNKLIIETDKMKNLSIKSKKTLKVYVNFKTLTDLSLHMVGNVGSDEKLSFDNLNITNNSVGNVDLQLSAKQLDLKNHSVGNLKLEGAADNAVVENNGVGNLRAGSFVVQTMDLSNSGLGNTEVNAEKNLKVSNSALGHLKNKGAAEVKKRRIVKA